MEVYQDFPVPFFSFLTKGISKFDITSDCEPWPTSKRFIGMASKNSCAMSIVKSSARVVTRQQPG